MTYEYIQTLHAILSMLMGVMISIVLFMPKKWRITIGLAMIYLVIAYFMYLGVSSMSLPIRDFRGQKLSEYKYVCHRIVKTNKKTEIIAWLNKDGNDRLYVFPYSGKLAQTFKKAAQQAKKGFPGKIIVRIKGKNKGNMEFDVDYRPVKTVPLIPKPQQGE